jgi:hypothetical protein
MSKFVCGMEFEKMPLGNIFQGLSEEQVDKALLS